MSAESAVHLSVGLEFFRLSSHRALCSCCSSEAVCFLALAHLGTDLLPACL